MDEHREETKRVTRQENIINLKPTATLVDDKSNKSDLF